MLGRIIYLFIIFLFVVKGAGAQIYKSDPVLQKAVLNETLKMSALLGTLDATLLAELKIQDTILRGSIKIKELEKIRVKSLSTVSSVIKNSLEIDLCRKAVQDIIKNVQENTRIVKKHPYKKIFNVLISQCFQDATKNAIDILKTIDGLVLKGKDAKGKNIQYNLISSADRLKALTDVRIRLQSINRQLKNMKYQMELYNWLDIARFNNPKLFYSKYEHSCNDSFDRAKSGIDNLFSKDLSN